MAEEIIKDNLEDEGIELEREIQEGKLHHGIGAVVQVIGKKKV